MSDVPSLKIVVQTIFLEKVWLKKTLQFKNMSRVIRGGVINKTQENLGQCPNGGRVKKT